MDLLLIAQEAASSSAWINAIGSGSLAAVLGLAVKVLWADNQDLRRQLRELQDRQRQDYRALAGLAEEDDDGGS